MQKLLKKSFCSVGKQQAQQQQQKGPKTLKLYMEGDSSEIIPKILRGKHRTIYDLKVGQNIHNFYVKEIQDLKQFNIKAFYLEHNLTKSKYIHLDSSDMNNVFSFIINTPNKDNRGLPLILEKMILCGSKNYPVRDPFKQLSETKSLNTYNEPETGNGYIQFPFSTKNEKDFYNLLMIYQDLIFKANLAEADFLTQNCRIEFRDHLNEKSELVYRGQVYEDIFKLKQIPDQIFIDSIQKNLYKNTDIQFSPGGELLDLQKVSYQEVLQYYRMNFTPLQCSYYSYGDMDFTKHLEFLNHNLLSEENIRNQALNVHNEKNLQKNDDKYQQIIKLEPNALQELVQSNMEHNINIENIQEFEYIKEVKQKCPPSFGVDHQGVILGQSYMCNDIIKNPETSVQLNTLSYALFEAPQSPFFQNFLEQGIASAYCPGYGYDMSTKVSNFTIGFKDIHNDKQTIYEIDREIKRQLKSLSKTEKEGGQGFDRYLIDLTLHQLEIAGKQRYKNFGIEILQNLIPYIIYSDSLAELANQSPIDQLKLTDFKKLRHQIQHENLFQNLIKKYFLENSQQLRVIVTPHNYFIQEMIDEENRQLEKIQRNLQQSQVQQILDQSLLIDKHFSKIQDTSILPSLSPTDIEPLIERFEYKEDLIGGKCPIIFSDQETNDMSHVRIKFDISDIDQDLYEHIEIFCKSFPSFGSLSLQNDNFEHFLDLSTSQLDIQDYVFENDKSQTRKVMVIKFSYLNKNMENTFNLINDWLAHPNFQTSQSKLSELLMFHASEKTDQLVQNTLDFAIGHASSYLTQTDKISNKLQRARQLCGEQLEIMKTTAIKQKLDQINLKLRQIYKFIMNKNRMSFSVTTSPKNNFNIQRRLDLLYGTLKQYNPQFEQKIDLINFKNSRTSQDQQNNKIAKKKIYMPMPISSNFVVESFRTPKLLDKDRPTMHLLGQLMKNTVLYPEIKEKRGAFDAGVYMNYSGTFSFYSYRDPNTLSTFQYFEQAVQYVVNNDFSDTELDEAKVSIFASIDKDIAPENKGEELFIYGLTDKLKKSYRDAILGTSSKEIRDVANNYLLKSIAEDDSCKVIIGQQDINLEGLLKRGWKIQRPLEDISVQHDSYEQIKDQYFKLPEII